MNDRVELRPAFPADFKEIAKVFSESRRTAMPYLPQLHSNEQIEQWILSVLLPHEEVWVAQLNGRTVGFISLKEEKLNHLYIDPGCQSRGLGGQLLDWAKNSSKTLRLYVFQKNAKARAFYEKRGFKLVSLSNGSQNEEKEPDAFYEWRNEE